MSDYKEFNIKQGKLLKKARQANNFKQADVAKYIGISQKTLSNYETGKSLIPPGYLVQFSRYYKKPITFFFMASPDNSITE